MAPYLKFFIPLAFSLLGIRILLTWPGAAGFFAFVGLFLLGSFIGERLFRRYATLDQIKQDLEARLHDT